MKFGLGCGQSRISDGTKSGVVEGITGREAAVGRAAGVGVVVPEAAADHAGGATYWTLWVARWAD